MKYLNKKYFIWLLIIFSALFYGAYVLIFPLVEKTLLNYLKPIPTVVSLETILVFIFVKWIWKFKIFYSWLVPFPDLNGSWKGIIKSNWIDDKTGKKPDPIPALLTIKQSFTNISCVMRTEEMTSYSFISGFLIDKENQIFRLVYSYDSIPRQIVKQQSPQHYGTISLDIINNHGKKELIGDYWTGRRTTGTVELEFWKKELLEKYPDELGRHPVSKMRDEQNC